MEMEIFLGSKLVNECLMVSVKIFLHTEFCCRNQRNLFYYYSALSPHANHLLLLLFSKKRSETKRFWLSNLERSKTKQKETQTFVGVCHRRSQGLLIKRSLGGQFQVSSVGGKGPLSPFTTYLYCQMCKCVLSQPRHFFFFVFGRLIVFHPQRDRYL